MKRIITLLQGSIFVRNSIILFAGSMVGNVFNYAFHFSLGRIVDAETYGAAQSLIALLAIVSVPAAALGMVATKYGAIAKARQDYAFGRDLFSYLNRRIIKYGWPLVAGGFLLTPFVQSFLKIDDVLAVSLLWVLAALTFFTSASIGILSGWQRFGTVNRAGIIGSAAKLLLGVVLAWFGFGLDGIIFGLAVAGIIGYFISVRGLRFLTHGQKDIPVASSEKAKEPFDFSSVRGYVATAFIGTLGLVVLGNVDIVLAKHSLDPELAGAYGALAVVAKVIFFVTGVMAAVLFAMSSESVEKNKSQPRNFSVFWMAFGLTVLAAAVAVIVYFLAPNFVMGIFFGDKYLSVAPYLGWFGLAAGLYAVVNLMLQQLLSMHSIRAAQWLLGIVIIESIGLFFWGTSLASIIGIVIGTQAVALLSGFVFIWKKCRITVSNER
ncbi:MAG: hypothetical protein AAB547_01450 [Patescibacteria group bacterium]